MDVIKDYLVSLGFSVDMNEYNRANRAINDLGKAIQSQTAGMSKNFTVAAISIVGALTSVAAATAGVIDHVAKMDMEYQKLGLHMWTTAQQAKEMKLALDAMGQSAEDVAWIPELRAQYAALINQGRQMQTPGDASGQLQNMRQIGFEFQRMKLEASYALEWIAYYLIKYLSGPLKSVKDTLKDFNDKISQMMPQWTEKVARWLTMIINLGKAGVRFIGDLADAVMRLFDQLPKGAQSVIAALAGIGASLLIFGPIGTLILGVLLLLEDFYGYLDGRKSSKTLAPIWAKLIEWFDKCKEWTQSTLPAFEEGWNTFLGILKQIRDFLQYVYELFRDIFIALIDRGAIGKITELFGETGKAINNLFKGLTHVVEKVRELFNMGRGKNLFIDILVRMVKLVTAFSRAAVGLIDVIGLALQGKFEAARAQGSKIFSNLTNDVSGALNPDAQGNGQGTNRSGGSGASNEQMVKLAKQVSAQTGIPAEWIYGQWHHETQGFTNWGATSANNFGGLKQFKEQPAWFTGDARSPEGDNYQVFNSAEEYAEYFARYLEYYRGDGVFNAKTPEEYAAALAHGGYYHDGNISNYAAGIRNGMSSGNGFSDAASLYNGYRDNTAATYAPSTMYSGSSNSSAFSTGDININVSSDTAQIAKTVEVNMKDSQGRVIARQTRELSGVYA